MLSKDLQDAVQFATFLGAPGTPWAGEYCRALEGSELVVAPVDNAPSNVALPEGAASVPADAASVKPDLVGQASTAMAVSEARASQQEIVREQCKKQHQQRAWALLADEHPRFMQLVIATHSIAQQPCKDGRVQQLLHGVPECGRFELCQRLVRNSGGRLVLQIGPLCTAVAAMLPQLPVKALDVVRNQESLREMYSSMQQVNGRKRLRGAITSSETGQVMRGAMYDADGFDAIIPHIGRATQLTALRMQVQKKLGCTLTKAVARIAKLRSLQTLILSEAFGSARTLGAALAQLTQLTKLQCSCAGKSKLARYPWECQSTEQAAASGGTGKAVTPFVSAARQLRQLRCVVLRVSAFDMADAAALAAALWALPHVEALSLACDHRLLIGLGVAAAQAPAPPPLQRLCLDITATEYPHPGERQALAAIFAASTAITELRLAGLCWESLPELSATQLATLRLAPLRFYGRLSDVSRLERDQEAPGQPIQAPVNTGVWLRRALQANPQLQVCHCCILRKAVCKSSSHLCLSWYSLRCSEVEDRAVECAILCLAHACNCLLRGCWARHLEHKAYVVCRTSACSTRDSHTISQTVWHLD